MEELELHTRIAVLQEQIRGLKEGIALQAKEYERRLDDLNHAAKLRVDRDAHFVSREAWDIQTKETEKWRLDHTEKDNSRDSTFVNILIWNAHIAELTIWRREVDKWRWMAAGMGILGGGIAGIVARFLFK